MFSIGGENGRPVAYITDLARDEFDVRACDHRILIGPAGIGGTHRMAIDRHDAGRLGRLMLLFERDGDLSRAAEVFDEGPEAPAVQSDIRDKLEEVEAGTAALKGTVGIVVAQVFQHAWRLNKAEERLDAIQAQLGRAATAADGRLADVEDAAARLAVKNFPSVFHATTDQFRG